MSFVFEPLKTIKYLKNRRYAPRFEKWDMAVEYWTELKTDNAAQFDFEYEINAEDVKPTVTWGTSPAEAIAIDSVIPVDANTQALDYMDIKPGERLSDMKIGGAFIGSCTNSRMTDLRAAAKILDGQTVAKGVKAICVPGSMAVRREAEAEGLNKIFEAAGFEWVAAGCAFCFYAGGETFAPETRVISSTNRNFEGRQGPGVRTHLASPAIVAASAIAGRIVAPIVRS